MAISYIGSATGTTSATIPTHQAGDLIVLFAYRDGSTTPPTNPGFTFTTLSSGGASTNSNHVAYTVAVDGSTVTGTWTNATSLIVHVYRGTNPVPGSVSSTGGASTTVSYPALTLKENDGTSWIAGFAGHRSTDTTLETAPTGMTNRSTVNDATDEAAGHDTNGGVSSWSLQTVSVGGTSSGWVGSTVEIIEEKLNNWDFVALGTQTVVASGDVTPGEPAGAAQGDLLVAYISARGSASFSLPSGWTLIGTQQTSGNTDVNLTTSIASGLMAYIVRGSSAPSLTFTRTGGDLGIGRIVAYRPPSGMTPVLEHNTVSTMGVAGTSVSVTGFTTTKPRQLICFGLAGARSMGVSAFNAATSPSCGSGFSAGVTGGPYIHAWQERHDEGWTTGADGSLAFADAVQKDAGATGNLTCSAGLSARHVVMVASFSLQADAAYSSNGVATVSGVSSTAGTVGSGAFASAGVATVSATGASTAASAYSSSGVAAPTGVGASTAASAYTSAGVAAISGVMTSTHAAIYSSSGVATPTGVGSSVSASAYSSSGVAAISGVMTSTHAAIYSAAGVATAASSGISTASAVYASVASTTVTGTAASTATSAYSSSGTAAVSGSSSTNSVQSGAYSSDGVATVSGVGRSTAASAGASSASATVSAASITFGGGSASSGGTSTVAGVGAAIGAGAYDSNGSSTATANSPVSGTVSYGTGGDEVVDLFIPARVATDDGEVAKRTG